MNENSFIVFLYIHFLNLKPVIMKESVLHYVWQHKLFVAANLKLTSGQTVEIIDVGKLNTDSGPDFFNAKIKMDHIVWAGNIEIHTRASDWYRHHHETDQAYDQIILHVVKEADVQVFDQVGRPIPQLQLSLPDDIEDQYESLMLNAKWVSCEDYLSDIHPFVFTAWQERLTIERLMMKTEEIQGLLRLFKYHWEEVFYIRLAEAFGTSVNGLAFRMLAMSLPTSVWMKHADHLPDMEALFMGQSGLLTPQVDDAYAQSLYANYLHFKHKYTLTAMDASLWKMLRLRPANFPLRRIAELAALLHQHPQFFARLTVVRPGKEMLQMFTIETSDYWKSRFTWGSGGDMIFRHPGKEFLHSLIINAVVPMLFSFAKSCGDKELEEKALSLQEQIPPENNLIIRQWMERGIQFQHAGDTQAWLHLKKHYCDMKKCLRCSIGYIILSKKNKK